MDHQSKRKLELFAYDPMTSKISETQCGELLRLANETITHDATRNNIQQVMVPYSVPRYNEDRVKYKLLQ